jgi:hypothetical protein
MLELSNIFLFQASYIMHVVSDEPYKGWSTLTAKRKEDKTTQLILFSAKKRR